MRKIYCPHCREVTDWSRFSPPSRENNPTKGLTFLRFFHDTWTARCGKCGMPWSTLRKRSFPQMGELEPTGPTSNLTS